MEYRRPSVDTVSTVANTEVFPECRRYAFVYISEGCDLKADMCFVRGVEVCSVTRLIAKRRRDV